MNRIIQAAHFADLAHKGQVRKYTGRPYITHPARVAARVTLLPTATEQIVCAAWLHDVVEDCGVSLDKINESFGPLTTILVQELTNTSKKDFPNSNRAERKAIDAKRLSATDAETQTIKIIDRIDNLLEMTDAPQDFYDLYLRESEVLLYSFNKVPRDLRDELRDLIVRGLSVSPASPAAGEGRG